MYIFNHKNKAVVSMKGHLVIGRAPSEKEASVVLPGREYRRYGSVVAMGPVWVDAEESVFLQIGDEKPWRLRYTIDCLKFIWLRKHQPYRPTDISDFED